MDPFHFFKMYSYPGTFLISLINSKTIIFSALIYILFKCIIDHYSRNPRWVKLSNELPGPRVYPIVGTTLALLIGARAGFGQLLVNYMNMYGPTFRLWIGQNLAVVISDVNDLQTVFTSSNCLEKKEATSLFGTLFGNSLPVAAPAAVWKHKRKECQPFFIKNALLGRVQEMNELNDKYVEKMKKEVDGPEFDLEHYMNDLSFDTIMKTHLSYDVSDEERKRLNICHELNEAFIRLAFNWFFRSSILQVIVQWLQPVDVVKTKNMVHNFIDKVINLIRKSPSWSGEKDETATRVMKRENFTQSYINTLYRLENELNEADLVRSELLTIIMAGSETTGFTMAFCFLALAAHPDIQERAYQEIYQVFGGDNRPADSSDLNKFPYLEQVIKETQRLFTIIPNLMRSIEKDIRIGAHTHPAGTIVMLNIGGIHHNPNIYPEPFRFNPENFTPEAIKNRHRYSFIPFSAGPRNCIGKEYAELNMKLRLISFLRTFSFHTNVKLEDIKLRAGILEGSSIGYPVSVKLRRKVS